MNQETGSYIYFDRDLSWLSFNERILMEAEREDIPLMERVNFLSIYSSNLDEFYRVRVPALIASQKQERSRDTGNKSIAEQVNAVIRIQLERFGSILRQFIPQLGERGMHLLYGRPLPPVILPELTHYFYSQVLSFLVPVYLTGKAPGFFPVNNQLYLAVFIEGGDTGDEIVIVNIPSASLSRFYEVNRENVHYFVFLEDVIRHHLPQILRTVAVKASFNFKVTRNSEMNLAEEPGDSVDERLERQILQREFGKATRVLYEKGLPGDFLDLLVEKLGLSEAVLVEGGPYHNLRDLNTIAARLPSFRYPPSYPIQTAHYEYLLNYLSSRDLLLHTPYQSYDTVLRFFNEASIDSDVTEINISLYRVASDSRIVNALISASKNGKKVRVFIELKARFDEANNLKWAKKLRSAGVEVQYSEDNLKVHAKIALVKRRGHSGMEAIALLATGNLNESTSRFYTDHILLTSRKSICEELEALFLLLDKEAGAEKGYAFRHLLVSQHNLQRRFLELIDREIANARQGMKATITIKLNNLEERKLINKLYEASQAGVDVRLIVRSICCLVPGIEGMSENISVTRIVDRWLEHGRVFVFQNNGDEEVYLGSADWMNRNIYRRIEVCFPVYDPANKRELLDIIALQLQDNVQAVTVGSQLQNVPATNGLVSLRSQVAIFDYLSAAKKAQAR